MRPLRESWDEILRLASRLFARQGALEAKIDQLLLETEFIRRRVSHYIGNGRALTHLDDETPIYVNSNDFGPPANILNGGIYEQDNIDVIFSFLKYNSVFLDVGANIGVFTLKVGARLRNQGAVHAFEPHPELAELLRGSAYLNGFAALAGPSQLVSIHQIALGNSNGSVLLNFPENHLGGGSLATSSGERTIEAPIQRLDDLFGPDFYFDIAKIDVEGHELSVLQGMHESLARSPESCILFEKHGLMKGYEKAIEEFFRAHLFSIYKVLPNASLLPLEAGELDRFEGDFLACNPMVLEGKLDRRFFCIHHSQFTIPSSHSTDQDFCILKGADNAILFHGPYWHLRKGIYRISFSGTIEGSLNLTLAHRFGHSFGVLQFTNTTNACEIIIDRDLTYFECVGRAPAISLIKLRHLKFELVG